MNEFIMQIDYMKISCKEDVHICHTNFAKQMERNLYETTSWWKTYGKRLFSKDLEVRDASGYIWWLKNLYMVISKKNSKIYIMLFEIKMDFKNKFKIFHPHKRKFNEYFFYIIYIWNL
jgi:hypothetical protein